MGTADSCTGDRWEATQARHGSFVQVTLEASDFLLRSVIIPHSGDVSWFNKFALLGCDSGNKCDTLTVHTAVASTVGGVAMHEAVVKNEGKTYKSFKLVKDADATMPWVGGLYLYGSWSAWPTQYPTAVPTQMPSTLPTSVPTAAPSKVPTTSKPTPVPSAAPSALPSPEPTLSPTAVPTQIPTTATTGAPVTRAPSPGIAPTASPSSSRGSSDNSSAPTEAPSPASALSIEESTEEADTSGTAAAIVVAVLMLCCCCLIAAFLYFSQEEVKVAEKDLTPYEVWQRHKDSADPATMTPSEATEQEVLQRYHDEQKKKSVDFDSLVAGVSYTSDSMVSIHNPIMAQRRSLEERQEVAKGDDEEVESEEEIVVDNPLHMPPSAIIEVDEAKMRKAEGL